MCGVCEHDSFYSTPAATPRLGGAHQHCALLHGEAVPLETLRAEVEQNTAPAFRQLAVVDGLRLVDRTERFHRFKFHDDFAETYEVRRVVDACRFALVNHGKLLFDHERDIPLFQLDGERFAVDLFEEATSELVMDVHSSSNDFVRLRVAWGVALILHANL